MNISKLTKLLDSTSQDKVSWNEAWDIINNQEFDEIEITIDEDAGDMDESDFEEALHQLNYELDTYGLGRIEYDYVAPTLKVRYLTLD